MDKGGFGMSVTSVKVKDIMEIGANCTVNVYGDVSVESAGISRTNVPP